MTPLVKKSCFLLLLLLAGCITSSAQVLVLLHANGQTTEIELFKKPKVTFSDDKMLITSPVLDLEFPATEILRFTYQDKSTDIHAIDASDDVKRENDRLVFSNVTKSDAIAVYTLNGIRVPVKATLEGGDRASLLLSSMPSGAFLVKVNGRTLKYTKP